MCTLEGAPSKEVSKPILANIQELLRSCLSVWRMSMQNANVRTLWEDDVHPHYVMRRYAEFTTSLIQLNVEYGDGQEASPEGGKIQMHFEDLLKNNTAVFVVVKLAECEIYSYNPKGDADPLAEKGPIWSYHFFFYNRKQKCVVSFRFACLSNLANQGLSADELAYEGDEEIFYSMDI